MQTKSRGGKGGKDRPRVFWARPHMRRSFMPRTTRLLCSLSAAFSAASRVVYVTKAQFDCGTSWMV
jgi:hypothetical protein